MSLLHPCQVYGRRIREENGRERISGVIWKFRLNGERAHRASQGFASVNESACRYGSRAVLLRYRSSARLLCRTSIVKATLIEASRTRLSLASRANRLSGRFSPSISTSALTLASTHVYTFLPRRNDTSDRSALGGNDRRNVVEGSSRARGGGTEKGQWCSYSSKKSGEVSGT